MDLQLTTKAQEAFSAAARDAAASGHPHVEPAHLLLALTQQTDTTTGPLLEADRVLRRPPPPSGAHGAARRCRPPAGPR